jgi:hypothetical protein
VACPFFFPTEKTYTVAWAFSGRLPLGAGFCGQCTSGPEPVTPGDNELKDFCNLGYATQCLRLPADRRADCVRFAVAKDEGQRIVLQYVCERDHAPVEHGAVEFDCGQQRWLAQLDDGRLQRQAEVYLAVYLERKPRKNSFAADERR